MCVFIAQFRMRAWSVTTTVLMINLKRVAPSFELVSLLDCAFWHTLLVSFIQLTIKIPIVLRRMGDDDFRLHHLLDLTLLILIHWAHVYVDLLVLRADDAIKWLFTHTFLCEELVHNNREKWIKSKLFNCKWGEATVLSRSKATHISDVRECINKYRNKETIDSTYQFALDFCVTTVVPAYARTNDV